MRNYAFTLIELLVVVLIIGILSAVALPQYQKTVDRARFVETMVAGDALLTAEKVYFLANGRYTNKLAELDIAMPGNYSVQDNRVQVGKSTCIIYLGEEASDSVWCFSPYGHLSFRVFLGNEPYTRYCVAVGVDTRANKICQSMTNSTGVDMSGNMYYAL